MPRRRLDGRASGSQVVSMYMLGGMIGGASASAASARGTVRIPVEVGEWIVDNGSAAPSYEGYPDLGTAVVWADVVHGLGSETATAIQYTDAAGRVRHQFTDQIIIDSSTVRIWLQVIPTGPITVLCVA